MEQSQATQLAERLRAVRENIANAARRAGRQPDDVTLVAVSKTVDADAVLAALGLGVSHFGENRVQEAEWKIAEVSRRAIADHLPVASWHLIGHLQSNKARVAAHLFSMIESVDSVQLATTLDRHARAQDRGIDVLLEVNVGGEASKFGFRPEETAAAFSEIGRLPRIHVVGLMTVAPAVADPEEARPVFRMLRSLRDSLVSTFPESDLRELSMGMTGDYPVAIEEGATIVRVGRAIFGERPAPPN